MDSNQVKRDGDSNEVKKVADSNQVKKDENSNLVKKGADLNQVKMDEKSKLVKIDEGKEKSLPKKKFGKKKLSTKTKVRRFVIGALCGYITGVVITILWFIFLTMQLNYPLKKGTYFTCVIATIFTLGLAYNRNIRCLTLLSLPIFCSAKGRSALMAFAFMLAVSGPCMNIMTNVNVLSKSMSCGQEQLKDAMEKMLDVMKQPLVAIKTAIKIAMEEIKKVMAEVEIVLKRIQTIVKLLLKSIKKAFAWLGNIVSICNKEIGTPFDRCMNIADKTIEDCKKNLGSMRHFCDVTKIFQGLCYSVKFLDAVCVLVDFISDTIVKTVTEKLEAFNKSVKEFFYVSITFDHDFYFKTVSTKNLSNAGAEILQDIRLRQKNLLLVFGWIEILGCFVFFIIILKTLLYKHKFLANNRFDNHYITRDFELIDQQRKEKGKEHLLPLTRKEKNRYVRLTSIILTKPECRKMARSLIFLIISCIQIFVICFFDYCVYILLEMIRYHGRKQAGLEVPPYMTVKIEGGGFIGDIYKGLVKAFEPPPSKYDTDVTECLPDPSVPNYRRYYLIGGLLLLAWIFVIIQPYLLRLRQVVMGHFYPEKNRERSVWLHNQIRLRRTTFLKFARRAARRQFSNKNTHDKDSLLDFLRAKTNNCWCMRKILGSGKQSSCILCATPLKKETEAVRCANPGCKGVYCLDCFAELDKACFLCREPIDYGDASDYSEEKDSSYELKGIQVTNNTMDANQNAEPKAITTNENTGTEVKTSTEPKSDAKKSTDDATPKSTETKSDAKRSTDDAIPKSTEPKSDAKKSTDEATPKSTETKSDAKRSTDDAIPKSTEPKSDGKKSADDAMSKIKKSADDTMSKSIEAKSDAKKSAEEAKPKSLEPKSDTKKSTDDAKSKSKKSKSEIKKTAEEATPKITEPQSDAKKSTDEAKPKSSEPKSDSKKSTDDAKSKSKKSKSEIKKTAEEATPKSTEPKSDAKKSTDDATPKSTEPKSDAKKSTDDAKSKSKKSKGDVKKSTKDAMPKSTEPKSDSIKSTDDTVATNLEEPKNDIQSYLYDNMSTSTESSDTEKNTDGIKSTAEPKSDSVKKIDEAVSKSTEPKKVEQTKLKTKTEQTKPEKKENKNVAPAPKDDNNQDPNIDESDSQIFYSAENIPDDPSINERKK